MRNRVIAVASLFLLLTLTAGRLCAAPFDREISFKQPGGKTITLRGWGDEFYAVFETLDGYAVVFDHAANAYCYATLSDDGRTLLPTQMQVGKGDPTRLGVAKHLRISVEARKAQVTERGRRWEEGTNNAERWTQLKANTRNQRTKTQDGPLAAPPSFTTTGDKVGLCLLVDFTDAVGTIPQTTIESFCNADGFVDDGDDYPYNQGNNGSVKKYYQDVSNNLLNYTNVVTAYVRMPRPKSYYNNPNLDCGTQGNLLIADAITAMRALPNYETEILPALDNLTVDDQNRVVATNVFYAGGNGGVWMYGLWPHSWSLEEVGPQELSSGGAVVWRYQITNIGSSLELGTFCHENGHMLCGFPDIYDYQYDSTGGAGNFCLMNSGGHGTNPVQVCAYLKYAAGWATTTELTSESAVVATLVSSAGEGFNHFYRYANPNTPEEYFLLENRQRAGRDASLQSAGIAVWLIDELGDRDNQSLDFTPDDYFEENIYGDLCRPHYEVTLMQADGLWDFEYYMNDGDENDLYYLGNRAEGYVNALTDDTYPSAQWWDGSLSGLKLQNFSASAATMTVEIGGISPLTITTESLPDGNVGDVYSAALTATGGTMPYSWWMLPVESLSDNLTHEGGLPQGWNGDEATWVYDLPFAFPYKGGSYTLVYVSENGYLDFLNEFPDYENNDEELIANARIAPLWDDLVTDGIVQEGEDIYIHRPDPDTVIIRWVAETYDYYTPVNFEVLLRRNGDIEFHYGDGNTMLTPTIGLGSGDPSFGSLLATFNNYTTLTNAQTDNFLMSLHSGLYLDVATGAISGIPTVSGVRDITFVCSDNAGAWTTKVLSLECLQLESPTMLNVSSTPVTGVIITSSTGHGGTTNYQVTVEDETTVTLTAPLTAGGLSFACWKDGEGNVLSSLSEWTGVVSADTSVVAVYSGIQLLSPSAEDARLRWGQQVAVQWATTANISTKAILKLELWNSLGEHWDIAPVMPNKTGIYYWTVGKWKSKTQPVYSQGEGYRLRISLVTDGTVEDYSDYPFIIGSISSIEIRGESIATPAPSEVPQNELIQFTCKGYFNFGDPQDVTAETTWKLTGLNGKSVRYAMMDSRTGLLTTYAVPVNTPCLITATCGKGKDVRVATTVITLKHN